VLVVPDPASGGSRRASRGRSPLRSEECGDRGVRRRRARPSGGGRPLYSTDPAHDSRLDPALSGSPSSARSWPSRSAGEDGVSGGVYLDRPGRRAPSARTTSISRSPRLGRRGTLSHLRSEEILRENLRLRRRLGIGDGFEQIVTQSPPRAEDHRDAAEAARLERHDSPPGETGTGKELFARRRTSPPPEGYAVRHRQLRRAFGGPPGERAVRPPEGAFTRRDKRRRPPLSSGRPAGPSHRRDRQGRAGGSRTRSFASSNRKEFKPLGATRIDLDPMCAFLCAANKTCAARWKTIAC